MNDDPEKVFDDLLVAMGAPALSPEEKAAVLRLAKVMADASERRFAPLTCYAAGLVIGTSEDRLERLRGTIDLVLAQGD